MDENNFTYMKTTSSKSVLWGSSAVLRLLIFFFGTSREFYEKQVRERTGLSLGAVNKHLKLLAGDGFLLLEKRGKMNFFRLNRDSAVVKHLKVAYSLSSPLAARLGVVGRELGAEFYLFGSVARGEDDESSDWDVLVIGSVGMNELEAGVSPVRREFGKEIKLTVLRRNEWLGLKEKDPAFYERLEKDRIRLA